MKVVRKLTPYEQLTVKSGVDVLSVVTPWLTLECEIREEKSPGLSLVLSELYRYPICYIHPRRLIWSDFCFAFRGILDKKSCGEIPAKFVEKRFSKQMNEVEWVMNARFEWDALKVLHFSRIGSLDLFDTLSAFSVLRRYLHEASIDLSGKEMSVKLEQLRNYPEQLRVGVGIVVAQNFFITRHCQEALAPASHNFPKISEKVCRYMLSEKGHDELVKKALKNLGFHDPEKLEVLAETRLLIDILRLSSEASVLAFATMVEFFESGSSSSLHPIAKILKGTQYAQAGLPLQRHRDINVGEGHSSTAFSFLFPVVTCTVRQIVEAVRLAELAMLAKRKLIFKLTTMIDQLIQEACSKSD